MRYGPCPERTPPQQAAALTRFWGDERWREAAYHPSSQKELFEDVSLEKLSNGAVVAAFRARLRDVAGFRNVPEPVAMKNSTGATVYYLFFASQNQVANKIVNDIFRREAERSDG
jgi:three-Cys-motif partner protein